MAARTGLSREIVLCQAEALVDRDGWTQLAMTSLARKLGVQAPSLYHYVGSIEVLLGEVQVRALGAMGAGLQRAAMGKVGAECFRALADEMCGYAQEHPGLYELSQSEPLDSRAALSASESAREALTAVIESFGIVEPGLDLLLTCLAPLHGVLALERSGAISGVEQRNSVYRRVTDVVILMLETEGKA